MNRALEDIQKVRKFAKKMGIKIRIIRKKKIVDSGYAVLEEKRIIIYKRPDESDLYTLASILHEVSHLLNYLINPAQYKEYLKIDDKDNSYRARKIQFEMERRDISKMKDLHSLLGLKSSQKAIIASELLDIHQYEHNLRYGRFPNRKERRLAKRDIKILAQNFI